MEHISLMIFLQRSLSMEFLGFPVERTKKTNVNTEKENFLELVLILVHLMNIGIILLSLSLRIIEE